MKTNKRLGVLFLLVVFLCALPFSVMAGDTTDALPQEAGGVNKPAKYPQEGALYGYGDDGVAELQYNARYLFEQSELPKTVLGYEKETIGCIDASDVATMKENILGIWDYAAATVIFNDAEMSGEELDMNDEAAFWAMVDERRPLYGLGNEHIAQVTMEEWDGDTKAIIVELLDTNWAMLSTYIGIAYNEAAGLKIFTLERSVDLTGAGTAPYVFCYVEGDARGNFGTINNDKQAFINAIKDVMNDSST